MKPKQSRFGFLNPSFLGATALLCTALFWTNASAVLAQQTQGTAQSQVMTTTTGAEEAAPKIPNDQLDSLVAPIALYPDPLLSQTLVASTYPLEIIQLEQWMKKNPNLKDKELAHAVGKQPWDPSIQAMAAFPEVVTRLSENIAWTSDLGNAFLAQQQDVMSAIQRMRGKAQGTGNLKTSAQAKVETQVVEGGKEVIVIQQADPEVTYVPSYDPAVVYGAAPYSYPYPSYYYPGYVAGTALMWGAGIAMGAAIWGGAWGNCGWGSGDININNNNNFNRNSNRTFNQGNKWGHNPGHRGNAPYGNRQTANKFGGSARGQGRGPGGAGGIGGAGRPGGAGGIGGAGRPGGAGGIGGAGRPGGAGGVGGAGRPGGAGGVGGAGAGNRPGGGAGAGNRPGGGKGPSTRPAGGGANKVGNRSVSSRPSSGGSRGGGFSGGSASHARASSSRGGHSMGGGGYSRGGGGGGYSRGGGGGGHRGGGGGGRGGGGGGRRR